MKKLFFILLLFASCARAQELPVLSTTSLTNPDNDSNFGKKGNYAQDTANERDQYVGIWEYNQNGILLQVKIEKKDQFLDKAEDNGTIFFYNYTDVVTFKYKLVKNGVIIHNNLNQTTYLPAEFIPTAIKKGTDNYLYGHFMDYTRNAAPLVYVTRLNTNPAKIIFNIIPNNIYLRNPREYYNDGQPVLTFPTGELEMVKIN